MSAIKEQNKFIDVICQYTKKGNIIPLRLRIEDNDGMMHEYNVKGYKETSHPGEYTTPYGTMAHSNNWSFRCKIQILDQYRNVDIFFNSNNNLWKITGIY